MGMSPDAMIAAASHVNREYNYVGYSLTHEGTVHGAKPSREEPAPRIDIFEVRHFDGSTFYVVADQWGNVATDDGPVTAAEKLGARAATV